MSEETPVAEWAMTTIPAELEPQVEKASEPAFRWPTPPFATYPEPTEQTEPLHCDVVGVNNVRSTGRLTFFVPEQSVAYVQMPPARTTFPLRFELFRSITLTTPLKPLYLPHSDPHSDLLGQRNVIPYRVALVAGGELTGESVGHVERDFGLFLFPEADAAGGVERMFIPRSAYSSYAVGARIGEVLIEQLSATPLQVNQAVVVQKTLRGQKIGDILLTRQLVTPEQLLEAIEQQARMPMVRIGEALLSLGMVSNEQLKAALEQQQTDRSVPLGELLVRMGVVSTEDLQVALARKMGYPLVNIDVFPLEAVALRALAYAVASRVQVLPLLVRDSRLIVAVDDPSRRREALEEVEFITQMKVVPVLAQSQSLQAVLISAYEKLGADTGRNYSWDEAEPAGEMSNDDTGKLVESLEREGIARGGSEDETAIEQSDNSLVRLINNMIIEAHKEGVSDIHIESYPGREKIRIRFRKDGVLRTYLELPPNYRSALTARIKIMCDLDISERRKPQDGKINFSKFSAHHKIELRVATIPTNNGLEDLVMRILASARPIPLGNLGLSNHNLEQFKIAVERPYGLVLCVGPTGSGKTTTLHSALSHINVPERKIWTAEDPIEITQPGLRQVQVNPRIEWTFAKALRAFLRADPDVIMVGEIRDQETAQVAIEASLTGHLVLSTLHTNSAPETVTRLLDMGMDPFNFADSLLAVLAQRLVRRNCAKCLQSTPATPQQTDELLSDYMHSFGRGEPPVSRDDVLAGWVKRFGRDGKLQAHRSVGCLACDHSGFKGRVGVHELMIVTPELRHLIQTGQRAEGMQQLALAEGMRSLRQDGIEKVLTGLTTIEEVRSTSNA
jgi:type II secretory ATPase GspE/PulE/Tfp pilus assembly ATPase PilB-like protein/GNAT superfamily N-acetyltransferase